MIFDLETLIEIEDYIEELNNSVGLSIETITDIKRAIYKQKSKLKNCAIPVVDNSTLITETVECSVCCGGGMIEVDDLGNDECCTWCNGTGVVKKSK